MKRCLRAVKLVFFLVLSVLLMVMIFGFSSQTAVESSENSSAVTEIINEIIEPIGGDATENFVRKAAHFSEYTLLGFAVYGFFRQCLKSRQKAAAVGICALYAITDEVHQIFVPDRACRIFDICIDTLGSLFGIAVYTLVLIIILRVNGGKREIHS